MSKKGKKPVQLIAAEPNNSELAVINYLVLSPYRTFKTEDEAFDLLERHDAREDAIAQFKRVGATTVWSESGSIVHIRDCGGFIGVFRSALDFIFQTPEDAAQAAKECEAELGGWPVMVQSFHPYKGAKVQPPKRKLH